MYKRQRRRNVRSITKPTPDEFVNITNADPLQIVPNEVIFKDI